MTLKKINDVLEIPDKFDEDITSNEKLIILFEKAKNCIIQMGYGHEIELLRNCYLENIENDDFFQEYVHVVLNSGFNNEAANEIKKKFMQNFDFNVIKHEKKRDAIRRGYTEHEEWLIKIKTFSKDEEIIEYIGKLPYIGDITKYHLARNIGLDVAKPDRHMIRIAEKYGYNDVNDMCQALANVVNERIGVIDTILWRYCTLKIGDIILKT